MPSRDGKHTDLTGEIISAFYRVYNALGHGFSERVYHDALVHELKLRRLRVSSEMQIPVYYRGVMVTHFFADLVVNECVIVELKAVPGILDEHRAQLLNYLKATTIEVGLLMNFGPEAVVERKIYDNEREGSLSWARSPTSQES